MSRTRLASGVAAVALAVAGLSTAVATPASASFVCLTNSPTPQYAGFDGYSGIGHQLTHSEGRGFRVYSVWNSSAYPEWAYGHGAQYPNNPGWVRKDRLSC